MNWVLRPNGYVMLNRLLKKFLIVLLVLLSANLGHTQEEQNGGNMDVFTNPLPYYSYKKGIGLTSPDSVFQMNFRFRMQNRLTLGQNNDGRTFVDGQIRRLRIRYDGYVGNPKFLYMLQLSFTPGDLGGAIHDGDNLKIIRDAVFFYRPNNQWNIGFGQTKLPGNRQRFNSSGALQLTDRSINNARFTIDRDFAVQANYLNQREERFSYNIKTAISMGEGRAYTDNDDAHLCYTGKIELYPLGRFEKGGEYFEGDQVRESKPKLLVSGAASYNDRAKLSSGQLGNPLYEKRDLTSYFGDLVLKYKGLALMTAYMQRSTKNPLTFSSDSIPLMSYVYAGTGMDYQASYLFRSNWEIIGRYSWQQVSSKISIYTPDLQQYSIGLTKYIWEHSFKLQLELTYNVLDYYDGSRRENWYTRFQVEMGI